MIIRAIGDKHFADDAISLAFIAEGACLKPFLNWGFTKLFLREYLFKNGHFYQDADRSDIRIYFLNTAGIEEIFGENIEVIAFSVSLEIHKLMEFFETNGSKAC